ncbi:DNA polymerase III subunit gamma and tau [Arthrobacter sp. HMSC06H05]|uniref:DNA polymerase III subunit gamma and tau n=1 Tax=Arthrobacter sp. HMSC06H05 TaxID=1581128 RepID=UPI0008A49542|nr:DNA polymerase III subunit gamma and tau [Arthrobacter sp. HMSC06H05]
MSTALYRRFRPDTFEDVIGQDHVTKPLQMALDKNRVNHAYLFSGPRGCGKTTSARILARCLNCENGPTSHPCGECPSCRDLATGGSGSLDVIEIDAASHGGVDDARELRERASFAPARDRYKIFIIDEAHMVTSAGFNALLKIVEEPPEHIKFIFATTEPEKVIGTIRSRTHHYPFRLIPPEPMTDYVQHLADVEHVAIAPGVVPLVVRAGGGSARDTLSVLDQLMAGSGDDGISYDLAVALLGFTHGELLDDVVDALAAHDSASVFAAVDRVIQSGQDPRRFVEDLLERFRDLILVRAVPENASDVLHGVPEDQIQRMAAQASGLGPAELSRWGDITNAALTEMTGATSPRLHLELLCARLLLPSTDDTERGLAARMDRVERHLSFSGGPMEAGSASPAPAPDKKTTQSDAQAGPSSPAPAAAPADAAPAAGRGAAAARAALRDSAPAAPQPSQKPEPRQMQEPAAPAAQATPAAPRPAAPTPAAPAPASAEPAQAPEATPEPTPAQAPAREPEAAPTPEPAATPAPASASEPAYTPEPAPETPPATEPEPAQQPERPAAGSEGSVEMFRRAWPQILENVKQNRRFVWSILQQDVSIAGYDGKTLTLGFSNPGPMNAFRNRADAAETLKASISAVIGVTPDIDVAEGGDASPKADGRNNLPAAEEPQHHEAPHNEPPYEEPQYEDAPKPQPEPPTASAPEPPAAPTSSAAPAAPTPPAVAPPPSSTPAPAAPTPPSSAPAAPVPPATPPAPATSPAARVPAASAPSSAPAAPTPPSGGKLSRYQQLLAQSKNNSQAPAPGWGAPAPQAPAPVEEHDFVPSEDDEQLENSVSFGRAAFENILNAKLIEETDLEGNPLPHRR